MDRVRLKRRAFLGSALLAGLFTSLFGMRTRAIGTGPDSAEPPASFAALASFLTGVGDLAPRMVTRAWTGLTRADASFGTRATALHTAIVASGFADVDAFAVSSVAKQAGPTARAIIAAFYTGRVGSGPAAFVVGYEDALMYRPTLDTTTIPTYANGGAGWWATKPPREAADV